MLHNNLRQRVHKHLLMAVEFLEEIDRFEVEPLLFLLINRWVGLCRKFIDWVCDIIINEVDTNIYSPALSVFIDFRVLIG